MFTEIQMTHARWSTYERYCSASQQDPFLDAKFEWNRECDKPHANVEGDSCTNAQNVVNERKHRQTEALAIGTHMCTCIYHKRRWSGLTDDLQAQSHNATASFHNSKTRPVHTITTSKIHTIKQAKQNAIKHTNNNNSINTFPLHLIVTKYLGARHSGREIAHCHVFRILFHFLFHINRINRHRYSYLTCNSEQPVHGFPPLARFSR